MAAILHRVLVFVCDCFGLQLSAIESALDKTEADLGLRVPVTPPPLTAAHLEMLDPDQVKIFQETAASLQRQQSNSIEEDPGLLA